MGTLRRCDIIGVLVIKNHRPAVCTVNLLSMKINSNTYISGAQLYDEKKTRVVISPKVKVELV